MHHAATAITAPDTDHLPPYWQFHDAVAQAQLLAWLPRGRHMIVDVSGPRSPGGELAAMAGHHVLKVIDAGPGLAREPKGAGEAPREPKGAGAAWTDERGTSEEGPPPQAARLAERRLKRRPEASGKILAPTPRGCPSCPTSARMTSWPRTGRCPPIWPPRR